MAQVVGRSLLHQAVGLCQVGVAVSESDIDLGKRKRDHPNTGVSTSPTTSATTSAAVRPRRRVWGLM